MNPRDLAVLLNVSQAQIARIQRERAMHCNANPSDYELVSWRREMRNAEMYLREWFKSDTPNEKE